MLLDVLRRGVRGLPSNYTIPRVRAEGKGPAVDTSQARAQERDLRCGGHIDRACASPTGSAQRFALLPELKPSHR